VAKEPLTVAGAIKKISKEVISLNDPATEDSNSQLLTLLQADFQKNPFEEVTEISLEESVILSEPAPSCPT
jgi:DNA-directed RNA polymerase sigma subunit (sigma70/sigma32)